MATSNQTRGVDKNQDLEPGLVSRDTRSWRQKIRGVASSAGAGIVVAGIGVSITAFPLIFGITALVDPLLVMGFFIWLYTRKKSVELQYCTPIEINEKGKETGDGLMFAGNDLTNGAEVWFSNDNLRTHMLVFGSTGSGKTRFLLGMLYQALLVGSGSLYCDGKGDNTVWWLVFSFCRRVGRVDDLLVINYLTGGEKAEADDNSLSRLSNTNNPFAFGDPEQLRSLIVGLMRDSGGDDMWKGMASAMMGGLLKALVYMRDAGQLNLDVSTIREYLPLDQIVRLSLRPELPESAIAPIKKYLQELPGYVEDEAIIGRINPKVYEQHGYRIMQFSEVLSDLEDTYGHIFSAPLGECDFKDVVFNRRILFVMLPALEKDPDALAGLGKLVVAGVRAALGPALGNKLEGQKSEVIDQKPTNSKVPFLLILDEYGYYSVKGFAVVAAQARSLGVSVIFAGQDYPSFKKGSEEEAQATIANTNVKIGMKVEEDETAKIIIERGAEADVSVTEGSERYGGTLNEYKDSDRVRIEKRKRIDYRDLVTQKPGQGHIMFGDELSRCQLFYAEPHEVEEGRLNKFVMVDKPQKAKIDAINGKYEKLNELFKSATESEESENEDGKSQVTDAGLKTLVSDFKMAMERGEDLTNAAIVSTGLVEWRAQHKDVEILEKAEAATKPKAPRKADKPKEEQTAPESTSKETNTAEVKLTKPAKEVKQDNSPKTQETPDQIDWNELGELAEEGNSPEEVEEEILETVSDNNSPAEESVKAEAEKITSEFEKSLNATLAQDFEKVSAGAVSHEDKIRAKPKNALKEIEKLANPNESEAEAEAERGLELLGQRSKYPNDPKPEKIGKNDYEDTLNELLTAINKEATE